MSNSHPRHHNTSMPAGFHAPVSLPPSTTTSNLGIRQGSFQPHPPGGTVQQNLGYNYSGTIHPSVHQSLQNYQCLGSSYPAHHRPNATPPVHLSHPDHPSSRKRPRDLHHCAPCNLSFESSSALASHAVTHIQCTECSFRASPKAVKAHHQASHGKFSGSGFKVVTINVPGCPVQRFRICVGNRPEDIQQWIAERRKRFPRAHPTYENKPSTEAPTATLTSSTPAATGPSTSGLSTLLDGYGSSSSSSDDANDQESSRDAAAQPVVNDMSAPSKESRPDLEYEVTQHTAAPAKRPCHFFARYGRCRNGDQCRYSHDVSNRPLIPAPHDGAVRPPRTKAPRSLLEKLLANDMRRERLLTIQLLEHIVDTDFLTKPRNSDVDH